MTNGRIKAIVEEQGRKFAESGEDPFTFNPTMFAERCVRAALEEAIEIVRWNSRPQAAQLNALAAQQSHTPREYEQALLQGQFSITDRLRRHFGLGGSDG